MNRRTVLASVGSLALAATAGCASRDASAPERATTPGPTSDPTESAAGTTTSEPCSVAVDVDDLPTEADYESLSPTRLVRDAEAAVAAAHFDPDGGFSQFIVDLTASRADDGIRVEGSVEVYFERTGDGPNATTAHVHLPYDVGYRVTDRRLVRRRGEGPTGVVACW